MARVRFEHVSKRFGNTVVLEDFSLDVPDGAFVALLGPSGSGKTTALRLLAGLESPTSGDIYIGDRRVNEVQPRDRDIAMVFQSYALYPHMTVYRNIAFGLQVRGMPKATIEQRVLSASQLLGIEPLLGRRPAQLSGGQRQRVAVARAIVREPSVFLFDEPLSNLDAQLRMQTRAEISKLHRRLGTTFVYVTHDQAEAMTMADAIAVLNNGAIQQVGSAQDLYNRPANRFVAGFIGNPAMNFFPVKLEGSAGKRVLAGPDLHLALDSEQSARLEGSQGAPLVLGIRPEDIQIPANVPSTTRGQPVRATVDVVEWLGNELLLHMALPQTTFVARVDPTVAVSPGETLELRFDMQRIHIFDAESELALLSGTGEGNGPRPACSG